MPLEMQDICPTSERTGHQKDSTNSFKKHNERGWVQDSSRVFCRWMLKPEEYVNLVKRCV